MRVVGYLPGALSGLIRFSLTSTREDLTAADVWLQFRRWPARKSSLAEMRAVLDDEALWTPLVHE